MGKLNIYRKILYKNTKMVMDITGELIWFKKGKSADLVKH